MDTILKNKISAQENRELFEQDGQYNAEKEIDIQSYGSTGNTVKDMNTTYLLSDLLTFSENGGLGGAEGRSAEGVCDREPGRRPGSFWMGSPIR